jgi:hypothetical protein
LGEDKGFEVGEALQVSKIIPGGILERLFEPLQDGLEVVRTHELLILLIDIFLACNVMLW